MKTVQQKLLEYCVKSIYTQCIDDNDILNVTCDVLGISEFELMNGFENISIDNEFDLDSED